MYKTAFKKILVILVIVYISIKTGTFLGFVLNVLTFDSYLDSASKGGSNILTTIWEILMSGDLRSMLLFGLVGLIAGFKLSRRLNGITKNDKRN